MVSLVIHTASGLFAVMRRAVRQGGLDEVRLVDDVDHQSHIACFRSVENPSGEEQLG